MNEKKQIGIVVLIVAAFACVPFILDTETSYIVYFLFMAFTYLALSQSWNLVAGYTGQISLGHHAFFGLGAYVMAIGWIQGIAGFFDPLGIFLSGLGPAILAIAVGIPLLSKLRGDYFALGTLGLGEILRVIFIQGGVLTGGSAGLMLRSSSYTSMKPYYFMALFLAILATAVNYFMIKSRIGLALIAVRDDETAAAANGINVLKYKVLAFAVGAFIAGLCGSLQGYYLFHIHPQNFYGLNWTLYPILMCVMGGSGTITGPIIGAIFLTAVFEMAKVWLPEIHPIFSGALIIATIIFLPDGLVRLRGFKKSFLRMSSREPIIHERLTEKEERK
jgi:branched-chain amino acid transport system permease protein